MVMVMVMVMAMAMAETMAMVNCVCIKLLIFQIVSAILGELGVASSNCKFVRLGLEFIAQNHNWQNHTQRHVWLSIRLIVTTTIFCNLKYHLPFAKPTSNRTMRRGTFKSRMMLGQTTAHLFLAVFVEMERETKRCMYGEMDGDGDMAKVMDVAMM